MVLTQQQLTDTHTLMSDLGPSPASLSFIQEILAFFHNVCKFPLESQFVQNLPLE